MDRLHDTPCGPKVKKVCERYLVPALVQLFEDYPFKIRGFHSDNGSE
jgi:hypothetical protein